MKNPGLRLSGLALMLISGCAHEPKAPEPGLLAGRLLSFSRRVVVTLKDGTRTVLESQFDKAAP